MEEVALLIKAANKFPGGVNNRWETIAAYVALHTDLPQRDPNDVIKKSKEVQKGSSQGSTVRQLQSQKKTFDIADAPSVRYDIEGELAPVAATDMSMEAAVAAAAGVGAGKKKKASKAAGTVANSSSQETQGSSKTTKPVAPAAPTAPTAPTASGSKTNEGSASSAAKVQGPSEVKPPTTAADTTLPAAALWTAAEQKMLEGGMKAFPPSWQGEGDRWDKIAESVPGRTKKECKLRVKVRSPHIATTCALQSRTRPSN